MKKWNIIVIAGLLSSIMGMQYLLKKNEAEQKPPRAVERPPEPEGVPLPPKPPDYAAPMTDARDAPGENYQAAVKEAKALKKAVSRAEEEKKAAERQKKQLEENRRKAEREVEKILSAFSGQSEQ